MRFFLTYVEEMGLRFSPYPEMDMLFFKREIEYLSPGLPLAFLEKIFTKEMPKPELKLKLSKELKRYGDIYNLSSCDWLKTGNFSHIEEFEEVSGGKVKEFNSYICGHQLTEKELSRFAQQIGVDFEDILRLIHQRVLKGWGEWVPAVRLEGRKWRCQRCGETELEEWPGELGMMATCRSCSSLGVSSSLEVLYRDKQSLQMSSKPVNFVLQPTLTFAQERASTQVLEFVQQSEVREALLWAACGAGKTEVCFTSAAWALEQGQSVLFAAPRQDVIHDVAPRLQRSFPELEIQILSGMTPTKYQKGSMVLATTHQILRFYQAFDLIFLDEMDAFPYKGSRMLKWGLKQALRIDGKILYLTATPTEEGIKNNKIEGKNLIRLPARHHRHSLPVPKWLKYNFIIEKPDLAEEIIKQLRIMVLSGPTLIFVPKISWVVPLVRSLRISFPEWHIEGSYSSDPVRKHKVDSLSKGEYELFICTSILERGVTITNAQVIVLAADHPIFDGRALVQMAGRAGRTKEYPDGQVFFVSKRKAQAITEAINWIMEQNNYATSLGLLD